jgi:hypothetical protein
VTRVFHIVFLAALLGCNAILGIDEARLYPDASAAAGGDGGEACSLTAPDPCNQCIAARCCDKFEACNGDADCKAALAQYNVCVGIDFTNDAGGTCDETFASASATRASLATCAFQNGSTSGCAEACARKPIGGTICSDYCTCAAQACPDKSFDGGDCLTICGAFSESQLTCRPYHCGLANMAKMNNDELGRVTHCGHTFGESLCP